MTEPGIPHVVFAAGGALETAFLPQRLFDLRADFAVRVSVALSPGALDFVTETAIGAVAGAPPYLQNREMDPSGLPRHVVLAEADWLVLVPATARIVAECALGIVSCPVTRLFAFFPKDKVCVAPAIHPKMDLRVYSPYLTRLRQLGCAVVGGADAFASWADVQGFVAPKLSRRAPAAGPVLLGDLGSSGKTPAK